MIYETKNNSLEIRIPEEQRKGYVNNLKKMYDFKFSGVFDKKSNQDDLFDKIGSKVIKKYLLFYSALLKDIIILSSVMVKLEVEKPILCVAQRYGKNVV